MIPEGWMTYSLGDICEDIAYGYTESASEDEIGPKFLRITDIQNYFINWNEVPFCPISDTDHKKYKLDKGDIVIARTGASTGVTTIFKEENIDAVYASYLIRYKINRKIANPFFVGYVLKSSLWHNHVNSIIGGSAQPGANAKQFAIFKFHLPPITEQSRITTILSSLDDKIELNLRMNKTLEAIAQAIFKEWFVDFKFPGFDGELVDGLPKGWKKGVVGDIYKTTSGGTPSRTNEDYYRNGSVSWVKSKELNRSFIIDTEEKITVDALGNSSAKIIPKYSLLIAMYGATVGEYAILSMEASCNQAICAILPSDNYPFTYILGYFKFFQKNFINQASGSAQQNISQALIQKNEITIPPSEYAVLFHKTVHNLYERIENNLYQNKYLQELRDTLLPKLMTGKI